jgi:release factor glutamine methyltransferase
MIATKDIFYLLNKYTNLISRIEAESLLMHTLNCSRLDLYVSDIEITEEIEREFDSLVKRRTEGEPLQYIVGYEEFMGLRFIVTKDVFIPRPETEILVSGVELAVRGSRLAGEGKLRILDMCTGSGNIAISLAKFIPEAEIIATDISLKALDIARKNAILHGVNSKILFCQGDLFDALVFDKRLKFDIIVVNPPYIKGADIGFLQKEVFFEPEIALNGGADGLDFYSRIARDAHTYLKKDGSILLEAGFGQARLACEIFSNKKYTIRRIIDDFAGTERVLWISLS